MVSWISKRKQTEEERQCMDSANPGKSHGPTLQDLPVEMLDVILLKSVISWTKASSGPLSLNRLSGSLRTLQLTSLKPLTREQTMKPIKLLMTVWSEWNNRISGRWFRIMFQRHSGITTFEFLKTIKLHEENIMGLTKLDSKIYVLCNNPSSIHVIEDNKKFQKLHVITLKDIICVNFLFESSVFSNCLYVHGANDISQNGDIWKVNADSYHITQWLCNISAYSFAIMDDDNVIILTGLSESLYEIRIYKPDAELVKTVHVPAPSGINKIDAKCIRPTRAVCSPRGDILVLSRLERHVGCGDILVHAYIFQLDSTGQVLKEVGLRNSDNGDDWGRQQIDITELHTSYCSLFLDKKAHRLLISDSILNCIHVYDSISLNLIDTFPLQPIKVDCHKEWQIADDLSELYGRDRAKEYFMKHMYFDRRKRQLYVSNWRKRGVDVYTLS